MNQTKQLAVPGKQLCLSSDTEELAEMDLEQGESGPGIEEYMLERNKPDKVSSAVGGVYRYFVSFVEDDMVPIRWKKSVEKHNIEKGKGEKDSVNCEESELDTNAQSPDKSKGCTPSHIEFRGVEGEYAFSQNISPVLAPNAPTKSPSSHFLTPESPSQSLPSIPSPELKPAALFPPPPGRDPSSLKPTVRTRTDFWYRIETDPLPPTKSDDELKQAYYTP
ncbi:uncharacterized protein VTP21DRAFT_7686 [Calcarisporiella thermophila]|uniref:uncharacterized protein n=1 Tax=Calcarisporiella thermophila TaxID=911321 RepID=UPI00374288F9